MEREEGKQQSMHVSAQAAPVPEWRLVARIIAGPSGRCPQRSAAAAAGAAEISGDRDVVTVLGGKASCRRKFVVQLLLHDAQGKAAVAGHAACKRQQIRPSAGLFCNIVASVAFAHDHSPVLQQPQEVAAAHAPGFEPPLFTTFHGVEFPAHAHPTPLHFPSACASFKLSLSLLSSKYDNRLFCICFTPHPVSSFPCPPPCFSSPIRSISRKRAPHSSLTSLTSPLQHICPSLPEIRDPAPSSPSVSPSNSGADQLISPAAAGACKQSRASCLYHPQYAACTVPAAELMASYNIRSRVSTPPAEYIGQNDCIHASTIKASSTPTKEAPPLQENYSTSPPSDPLLQEKFSPVANLSTSSAAQSSSAEACSSCSDESITHESDPFPAAAAGIPSEAPFQAQLHEVPWKRPATAPPPISAGSRPNDVRVIRPLARVGVCRFPFLSAQSAGPALRHQILSTSEQLATCSNGHMRSECEHYLNRQRIQEEIVHNFTFSRTRVSDSAITPPAGLRSEDDIGRQVEVQVQKEEWAIQNLELSLAEMSREIQRRKEEVLRLKRRRLAMHYVHHRHLVASSQLALQDYT
ncbi:hypothetical protein L7F22_017864 [Adiantum nelumboides]|nr:hypothetical protein [Adiantum nelumboides]